MENENFDLQELDDDTKELYLLKETIELMKKVQNNMASLDNVKDIEYKIYVLYLEELKDRAMKLEIKINGCILEEV